MFENMFIEFLSRQKIVQCINDQSYVSEEGGYVGQVDTHRSAVCETVCTTR